MKQHWTYGSKKISRSESQMQSSFALGRHPAPHALRLHQAPLKPSLDRPSRTSCFPFFLAMRGIAGRPAGLLWDCHVEYVGDPTRIPCRFDIPTLISKFCMELNKRCWNIKLDTIIDVGISNVNVNIKSSLIPKCLRWSQREFRVFATTFHP